jgi:hypothetical protein
VDVESVSRLEDVQFLYALLANEFLAPLSKAVRGERQRKCMAAVATTINMFQVSVADMFIPSGSGCLRSWFATAPRYAGGGEFD